MTVPPLLKESEPTSLGWNRRVRDLLNMVARRTLDSGATAERPVRPTSGQIYYDEDLKRPVWWDSAAGLWRDAGGADQLVTVTANQTVGETVCGVINNKSGSTLTLTLPDAASHPGRIVRVKTLQAQTVISASSNVTPIASATAGSAILPATAGAWAWLVSDGANWVMMARGT